MRRNTYSRAEGASPNGELRLDRRSLVRAAGIGLLATAALGGSGVGVSAAQESAEEASEANPWRPEYHFAPAEGWMNDPNGMVYHDGVYHLFFQHNPHDPWWAEIQWGHATSEDLVTWEERGIKLPSENGIFQYSGGAVVDERNTAGFGEDALLLSYTGHHDDSGIEDQRLAHSTDNGETVTKYDDNPVIEGDHEFRDPNVIWYEPDERWIMVVSRVQPTADRPAGVEFYSSEAHVDWTYESTHEIADVHEATYWECPDLYELPVEGVDASRWVLTVSPDGERVDYLVGEFDGTEFTLDRRERADYGYDFYAAMSWANEPADRRIGLAWMAHLGYIDITPETGRRGTQTFPRRLTLEAGDGVELRQRPAEEVTYLRREALAELGSETITPDDDPLAGTDADGRTLEIVATIDPGSVDEVGLRVREGADQESVIVYDAAAEEVRFDRSSADEFFDPGYDDVSSMPLEPLEDGTIELHVLVDRSSVEIFANDGRRTMTNLVFPDWDSTGASLFAEGGSATVEDLVVYDLDTSAVPENVDEEDDDTDDDDTDDDDNTDGDDRNGGNDDDTDGDDGGVDGPIDADDSTDDTIPGFGHLAGAVGAAGGAYYAARRRRGSEDPAR